MQGFELRVSVLGFGFRVSGFGFRVASFRFRVSGFRFQVSGFGFQVSGFGFRVFVLGEKSVAEFEVFRRLPEPEISVFVFWGLRC